MRILFLGDVVGKPGRQAISRVLPRLIDRERLAQVIANGENVCDGAGIDRAGLSALFTAGVDIVTSGNHIFRRKEALDLVEEESRLIRPANFPPATPGRGWTLGESADGHRLAVVNLMGRVFMHGTDCPFRVVDSLIQEILAKTSIIFVDMHAEATSEKAAMGWHLDGRATAVLGTHTHVQTADERILPGGTAFMTDVGMCGPIDSAIGVDPRASVERFLTQMPVRFQVASGPVAVQGAIVDVDPESGRAVAVQRVREVVEL